MSRKWAFSAAFAALLALASIALAAGPKTKRVSLTSAETEINVDSHNPDLSATGRFVAFQSQGVFVAGDGNTDSDIFLRDRREGETERISVDSQEIEVDSASGSASVSDDGRFVTFFSNGAFTIGDAGGDNDIFLRDTKAGTTSRMSVKSNGNEVNVSTTSHEISGNGRVVMFGSTGAFTPGDGGTDGDVFVHDRTTDRTKMVSVKSNGNDVAGGANIGSISTDGRFVCFESYSQFTGADDDDALDVYVHDRQTGHTRLASVRSNGNDLGADAEYAKISGNGRDVVFSSYGKYAKPDDNDDEDIFVHDRKTGKTKLISLKSNGEQVDENSSSEAISASGRFIAFSSGAAYTGGDDGGDIDGFVRDLQTGKTRRVSVLSNGDEVPGASIVRLALSANGRFAAFQADDAFTGGDAGSDFDIFTRGPLH